MKKLLRITVIAALSCLNATAMNWSGILKTMVQHHNKSHLSVIKRTWTYTPGLDGETVDLVIRYKDASKKYAQAWRNTDAQFHFRDFKCLSWVNKHSQLQDALICKRQRCLCQEAIAKAQMHEIDSKKTFQQLQTQLTDLMILLNAKKQQQIFNYLHDIKD